MNHKGIDMVRMFSIPWRHMTIPSDLASCLDHESLNFVLQTPNLPHQITRLVRRDTCRYDGSADTTCPAKRGLRGNVDIWDVLVLTQ